MAALFGSSAQRHGSKKHLLEFKAGKMYLEDKMCHADKRKGVVYIHQTEDALMHFCWKDRTTGKIEDVSLVSLSFRLSSVCYYCQIEVYLLVMVLYLAGHRVG